MKAVKIFILSLLIIVSLGFSLTIALAQTSPKPNNQDPYRQTCDPSWDLKKCNEWILQKAGGGAQGYGSNTDVTQEILAFKVGSILGMVLSVFGIVFFCLVVFSGIQWMTAGGNEEKVEKAKDRIIRAAIGFGVIMMAWALTKFLVTQLQTTNNLPPVEPLVPQCTQENYIQTCQPICGKVGLSPIGCDNQSQCQCEDAGTGA